MTFQPAIDVVPVRRAYSYHWYQVWWSAVMHPTPESYERWLNDPRGTIWKSIWWVVISSVISGFLSAFLLGNQGTLLLSLVCGIPVSVVMCLLGMAAFTGCIYGIGRWRGGDGGFVRTAYALAAPDVPITVLCMLVLSLPLREVWFALVTLYWLWLVVVATKSVHHFTWKDAWITCSPIIGLSIITIGVSIPLFALLK